MKIDLKKYFEERDRQKSLNLIPGPVITFSREYGCEANRLAAKLVRRINEYRPTLKRHPWSIISKEILEDSAKILGISPQQVDQRILLHSSNIVNEIFSPYNHHYNITDRIILEKVREIILTYSKRGNIIIVGRGGSIVTQKFSNTLHVRLIASIDWRTKKIAKDQGIHYNEAWQVVQHFDETRTLWMEHLSGKRYDESLFDLILNVQTMSEDEMVEVIIRSMQMRRLISEELISKEVLV